MRRRRGISPGTYVTLTLTALVLVGMGWLLLRLSGGERLDASRILEALPISEGLTPLETSEIPIQQGLVPLTTATPTAAPAGGLVQLFGSATTAPPSATPAPTLAETRTCTLTAGGIVSLEKAVRQSGYYADVDSYDLTDIFSYLSAAMKDSYAFVTLENLVVSGQNLSDLIAPEEVMAMLTASGIRGVCLGFARMFEYGYEGLNSTLLAAEGAGLEPQGAYRTEQMADAENRILLLDGVKVALIHVTDGLTTKSTTNLKKDNRTWSVSTVDTAAAQIAAAREAGAEVVVLSIHWGSEGRTTLTNAQKKQAQSLADAGADVIIGAGARRVQPVTWLTAADGRQVLCAYDLGCLLSDDRKAAATAGLLLRLDITVQPDGRYTIAPEAVPTYLWRYPLEGTQVYRSLACQAAAPGGMSEADQQAMQKALESVRGILAGGAAEVSP